MDPEPLSHRAERPAVELFHMPEAGEHICGIGRRKRIIPEEPDNGWHMLRQWATPMLPIPDRRFISPEQSRQTGLCKAFINSGFFDMLAKYGRALGIPRRQNRNPADRQFESLLLVSYDRTHVSVDF